MDEVDVAIEDGMKRQASLYQKLHAIMGELDFIEKDKVNPAHRYNYASEHAIKSAVQPLLYKYRVLFALSVVGWEKTDNAVLLNVAWQFIDIDTGATMAGHFIGTGATRDEKGYYAAVTGAIKYILTSNLLIPTGDDPEASDHPVPPVPVPAKAAAPSAPKPAQRPAPKRAPGATLTPEEQRQELEKRFYDAWNESRTPEQKKDKEDWKNRGTDVKRITGATRFKKPSEMTDAELVLCIDAWSHADEPPLEDDAPPEPETEFNF